MANAGQSKSFVLICKGDCFRAHDFSSALNRSLPAGASESLSAMNASSGMDELSTSKLFPFLYLIDSLEREDF